MARLEDKQKPGLPPPLAATRRGANPWKFSDSARKAEPRTKNESPGLLDTLVTSSHASATEAGQEPPLSDDETPPHSGERRGRFGLWLLGVVAAALVLVLRVNSEAREISDWVKVIAPLLAIAFVAHGWWKLHQRRKESKERSWKSDEKGT